MKIRDYFFTGVWAKFCVTKLTSCTHTHARMHARTHLCTQHIQTEKYKKRAHMHKKTHSYMHIHICMSSVHILLY